MESFRSDRRHANPTICKPIIGAVLLARQISSMCIINYDRTSYTRHTISVIWYAYDLSSSGRRNEGLSFKRDRDSDSSVNIFFA